MATTNSSYPQQPSAHRTHVIEALFGKFSAPALLLKYAELIDVIGNIEKVNCPILLSRLHIATHAVEAHYQKIRGTSTKSIHFEKTRNLEIGGKRVIKYLRDEGDLTEAKGQLLTSPFSHIIPKSIYIYIVDIHGNFVVDEAPLRIDGLFSRSTPGKNNHLSLSLNVGCMVQCAGEVIFADSVSAGKFALVNNRSGHYLPKSEHLASVVASLTNVLGVAARNIIVFSVERE